MANKLLQEKRALEKQINEIGRKIDQLDEMISGDKPDREQAARIKSQRHSFGVVFNRRKALKKVKQKGLVRTSARRFTSRKEATHHAKRFVKIHKHKGFKVVWVAKRANAWINWITGKTNPVITG